VHSDGLIAEAWAIFDLPRMLLPLGVDLLRLPPSTQPPAASGFVGSGGSGVGSGGGGLAAVALMPTAATGDSVALVENNTCSNAYTQPPGGAQPASSEGFDCPAFVIKSTDETWHARSWDATNKAVDTCVEAHALPPTDISGLLLPYHHWPSMSASRRAGILLRTGSRCEHSA
jgi:hypothetical protein